MNSAKHYSAVPDWANRADKPISLPPRSTKLRLVHSVKAACALSALSCVLCHAGDSNAQSTDSGDQKTRGLFVAAFIEAFAPSIAGSIADWIGKKVFGEEEGSARNRSEARDKETSDAHRSKGKLLDKSRRDSDSKDESTSDRDATNAKQTKQSEMILASLSPSRSDNPRVDQVATLAILIEAHAVSKDDKPTAKLTREGSNEITLHTNDRFILKFLANAPGLLRAVNVDENGVVAELGSFAIPAREEVIIPGSKAFRMVGNPGDESLRLVFFPCRAYSAASVKTRGIVNENQAASMVESDQALKNSALASIEDCSRVDVTQVASIATRGIQNENFSGGIALTSTARSESGKVLPVERIVKVTHKPRSETTPKPSEADSKK